MLKCLQAVYVPGKGNLTKPRGILGSKNYKLLPGMAVSPKFIEYPKVTKDKKTWTHQICQSSRSLKCTCTEHIIYGYSKYLIINQQS